MLNFRLQALPKFVDLDGVVMPLPRIRGRRLTVNTLDYDRMLPAGSKDAKTVEVHMFRFGGAALIPGNGSPGFGNVKVAGYSLALFPIVSVRVERSSIRVGNKGGKKTFLGYWHHFRIEHTFGGVNYAGHANVKLTANELLRCYLAYADSIGLVSLVNDPNALVLPAVEWLEKMKMRDACKQQRVKCKLVRKNAYSFNHPWAVEGTKVTIYRIGEGSVWARDLGAVYAHVFPIFTTRGDTAVVLSKSRLSKKAIEGIYNTYDERCLTRGLPQSPLPLEYRGQVA